MVAEALSALRTQESHVLFAQQGRMTASDMILLQMGHFRCAGADWDRRSSSPCTDCPPPNLRFEPKVSEQKWGGELLWRGGKTVEGRKEREKERQKQKNKMKWEGREEGRARGRKERKKG